MGDSTNKAEIENIFLLKLKVIFSEIFFMEFIVSIYLKVLTWWCPQKTPPRGWGNNLSTTMDNHSRRWTFIVHDGGHMSHNEGLLVIMLSKMAIHKTNALLRCYRGAGNLLSRSWKESKIISKTHKSIL